jgi:hypothetical protein
MMMQVQARRAPPATREAAMKAANDNTPVLPPSLPPLGLSRVVAAEYVGVGPTLFDEMVRDGRMPRAKRVNSRVIWDRREIELAFAALPTDGAEASDENPWDEVLRKMKTTKH